MLTNVLRVALLMTVLLASGCSAQTGVPRLQAGSIDYQRRLAHQFDPYPESTLGTKLDGSRPREFSAPPPEPQKARWVRASQQQLVPLR